MAMSRGHLAAGKQRLKDKLKTIDELKTRILQYVTNLTEQPTEAALQLLEETDRGRFFGKFSSVSEDLEKCLDTLFLLCVSLNNDEGEGCDYPVSEMSSSESSESSNRANQQPRLPDKTEVSSGTVSGDTGNKRHKIELKEMACEDESGFSSIQIDSESDTLQEHTCKKDESVTSSSSSHQSFQSSPDQPGSMPEDCTVTEQQETEMEVERKDKDKKVEASSGNGGDVDSEGLKRLDDMQPYNMLGKEAVAPEERQDDSMVWRNGNEEGTNVPAESLAPVQNYSQDADCKSFAKEPQNYHHRAFGSAPDAEKKTRTTVMKRLWFSGEEVPMPSDSESELSSISTSQPNMNITHSSEDYSTKDGDSPQKETPWLTMKQGTELEGDDDFEKQPERLELVVARQLS
ncbi:uncharacterized protein [Branchiostoma lanceolatum]|uniref:uncharacterized protein n=1 Tax=Branchiostoma lanceolatum TaxID=7740 RepID=UPI003453D78E